MKNFLLLILLLVSTTVTAYGQVGRTSAAVQDAPFSQLTTAVPDGQERHCINCGVASDGTCESGVTQAYAIKLSGVWKCSLFNNTGGGGGSGVTSFNGRVGVVIPTLNDYTFGQLASKPTTLSGYGITNAAFNGNVTASGLTMNTAKLLGRSSGGIGAIQEITVGSGLSLSGGTLIASGGGGSIGGSGSTNTVPKFTASTTIGNSSITDDGTTVSVVGDFANSGTIVSLSTVKGTGLISSAAGAFQFLGRSQISAPADGQFVFTNAAGTSFSRLFFKTSSGPNIEISGSELKFNSGTSTGGTANVTASQFTAGPSGAGNNGFTSSNVDGSVSIVAPNNSGTPYTPWTLTLPLVDGNSGQFLQTNGSGTTTWASVTGTGDVVGPGLATDNAIARFDGTTGKLIQNSVVTVADTTGDISSPGSAAFGVGGAVAGNIGLAAGTATGVVANTIQLQAPTSVTNYNIVFPSAAGDGVLVGSNAANVVTESFVATTGTGSIMRTTAVPYDPAFLFSGVPTTSQTLYMTVGRAFDSTTSFAGTACSASVAATAQTDFLVKKNGSTVATLRFASSGTTCSIVSPTTTAFAAADVITIVAPASADATLANVAITILGTLH